MQLRSRVARALGIAIGLYAAAAGAIVWAGLRDERALADVIVVLGTTVHEDGSLSARLKARLDAALELYRAQLAPVILVSGGFGREGHDEAVAMAAYLVKQGVFEAAIVRDSHGDTTALTAAHTASHLRARGQRSVLEAAQYSTCRARGSCWNVRVCAWSARRTRAASSCATCIRSRARWWLTARTGFAADGCATTSARRSAVAVAGTPRRARRCQRSRA